MSRFRTQMRRSLGKEGLGWRILVGVVCVFCLALFLHFREVRMEALELNTTASRYIVAQIDFEFPDYETTIILKQQALQDVGEIYRLDQKQIRTVRFAFENSLIHGKKWRSEVPESTFEQMHKIIDEFEEVLQEARFTDGRTIQIIKEVLSPPVSYYELIIEPLNHPIRLPPEFWGRISDQIAGEGLFSPQAVVYVARAFEKKSWKIEEDLPMERLLRTEVSKTVPEKYTKVQAGSRMIDQGERVTSRHLTMLQAMKTAISESRKLWEPLTLIASTLLSFIFVLITAVYFRMTQPSFFRSLQQISLFACIILLTLLVSKVTEYALLKSTSTAIEAIHYPVVAPFATILICILLSGRIALFAAAFLSIILSVSLAVDHSRFLILNLITSIVVIICARHLRKRKEVFSVCFKAWLSSIPVLYAFTLSENHLWSPSLFLDIGASFVFLNVTAIVVVGLLPALETIFRVLTDMTLMEYMDPNNELLRRLAVEVPGTYQHCLVLGNLAETCAQEIGANGLLCRVATLYHDIGKLMNPQFYTENQAAINIHQLLTPFESAQVIISHVADGEVLARKYGLPEIFIDIIRQHHGTTLVYYFYRKQLEVEGRNKEAVEQKLFRYPGPKPQTKEAAVIMICDTIEAASRSLEETSEAALFEMVQRLVGEKAEDGQFDECDLTFEELDTVKHTLVKSLLMIHHVRVKYPTR